MVSASFVMDTDFVNGIDLDSERIEKIIIACVQTLNAPVEIRDIEDCVLNQSPIPDFKFRYALSHLLASQKLILDNNRRIIVNKL
jgi:hypothetical protein